MLASVLERCSWYCRHPSSASVGCTSSRRRRPSCATPENAHAADRTFNPASAPKSVRGTGLMVSRDLHRQPAQVSTKSSLNLRPASTGDVAHNKSSTPHSHSIISHRPNSLFRRQSRASNRTDTVRHTAETDRWTAIDPESGGRENLLRVTSCKHHSPSDPSDFTVGKKLLYRRRSYARVHSP